MSLIRYSSKDYVPATFSSLIDQFFNDAITRAGGSSFQPSVDIVENDTTFELHLAVPGVSKEDFKIEAVDNVLTVSGERKYSNERKEANYRSVETQFGAFSRSFALPENVDSAKINAKYNSGILEVTIPKEEKKEVKKTIKVN